VGCLEESDWRLVAELLNHHREGQRRDECSLSRQSSMAIGRL
jgi:hypothetical protein